MVNSALLRQSGTLWLIDHLVEHLGISELGWNLSDYWIFFDK
jgi:hypothetical protein